MECPLTKEDYYWGRNPYCLNPCSNGMPSDIKNAQLYLQELCLNPCSNGMPSDTMIQRALTFLLF